MHGDVVTSETSHRSDRQGGLVFDKNYNVENTTEHSNKRGLTVNGDDIPNFDGTVEVALFNTYLGGLSPSLQRQH